MQRQRLTEYQKNRLRNKTPEGATNMLDYIEDEQNYNSIKSGLNKGWGRNNDMSDAEVINLLVNYDPIPANCTDIEGFYEAYAKWRKSTDAVKSNELLQFYQGGGARLKKSKKKIKHRKRSKNKRKHRKRSKKSYKKRIQHRKKTNRR